MSLDTLYTGRKYVNYARALFGPRHYERDEAIFREYGGKLNGTTLHGVGKKYGLTASRTRQITERCLRAYINAFVRFRRPVHPHYEPEDEWTAERQFHEIRRERGEVLLQRVLFSATGDPYMITADNYADA